MAQHLEALGHEVIVADPNYAPMYATRARRVKTDRRDVRTLMEACRSGTYRPAHRLSAARRHVRAELAVREAVVRTRTRYVALAKALVRRDGLRVPSSAAERVGTHLQALPLAPALAGELAPLLTLLVPLNETIAAADRRLTELEWTDPSVALLMTAPGVGAVTASALVATIDERHTLCHGASVRGVPRRGARGTQLGGTAAHRADQEGRQSPGALAPGRSGVADSPGEGLGGSPGFSTRCGATAFPMMPGRSVDPAARRGCRPGARRLLRCEALVRPSQLLRTTDALLTDRQDSRAELFASILQAFLRA